ncbi:unnamed protein product [Adineta steineri]|uniref:Uncharacterized protein n=1 Tax=Adineta steineri TaxID=433720 RepID=A0A814N7J7_9BILA|nr:unnamed protein product [Adineta steineri]
MIYSHPDISVYDQLQQLQAEFNEVKNENKILKISGRLLLERAPQLITMRPYSNTLQETLDYIIQKQENEIHRLHDELQREIYRCFERIHDLELLWKGQVKQFLKSSDKL